MGGWLTMQMKAYLMCHGTLRVRQSYCRTWIGPWEPNWAGRTGKACAGTGQTGTVRQRQRLPLPLQPPLASGERGGCDESSRSVVLVETLRSCDPCDCWACRWLQRAPPETNCCEPAYWPGMVRLPDPESSHLQLRATLPCWTASSHQLLVDHYYLV